MTPLGVVPGQVLTNDVLQMPFGLRDHEGHGFALEAADESFDVAVAVRGFDRCPDQLDSGKWCEHCVWSSMSLSTMSARRSAKNPSAMERRRFLIQSLVGLVVTPTHMVSLVAMRMANIT